MSIKDYFIARQREIDRKRKLDTASKVGVGLTIGTLVGSAVGVLFAPKSGKETREDLKDVAEKSVETIKTKTNELGDTVQQTYTEAVNKFNKFSEEKLTQLKLAKDDAEEKVEEVKEDVKDKALDAKANVAEGVDKAAKKVEEGAKKVSDKAKEEEAKAKAKK